jgi:hypothetical protein
MLATYVLTEKDVQCTEPRLCPYSKANIGWLNYTLKRSTEKDMKKEHFYSSQVKKGGVGNWWKDLGRCCTPAVHGVHTEGEEGYGEEDGPLA